MHRKKASFAYKLIMTVIVIVLLSVMLGMNFLSIFYFNLINNDGERHMLTVILCNDVNYSLHTVFILR